MKVENGKITEITEQELFRLYLDRGYDDCMDFHECKNRFVEAGAKIIKED